MRLTKFTDNALRVLIYAALHENRMTNISEISKICVIPRNHLTKVIHTMSTQDLLETTRGKGGGIRLARDASLIKVSSVVEIMEGNMKIIECFKPRCPIVNMCKLRHVLNEARSAFLATLEAYTIADLIDNGVRFNEPLDGTPKDGAPS